MTTNKFKVRFDCRENPFFSQFSALKAECVYNTWQSTVNKPMKPEDSVVVQVTGHYDVNIVRLMP